MKKLIRAAHIVDPNSPYHNTKKDILIENSIVTQVTENYTGDFDEEIKHDNLHICPGLLDMRSHFCDPGHEQHEDLSSGLAAAEAGGYTAVCVMPGTTPSISSRGSVEYLINRSLHSNVTVYPVGSATHNIEGKELSEMYDMKAAGAIAFSDDKKSITDANLMSRALLYAKNVDTLIMAFPNDKSIAYKGQINEGVASTNLGLAGLPALAEELNVSRDLFLANYNESSIHIGPISSGHSVAMIKEAKEENIKISCDVAAHQLALLDEDCESFDSNYKVMPPLRTKEHQDALIEGLKSGVIDVITSDHTPWDVEEKEKEFDLAQFGIIGLQTSFALAITKLEQHIGLDGIVQKMSINPRTILKVDVPMIREGFEANFTLFNPTAKWTLESKDILSKSKNTPFIGTEFTGKVLGIVR
ncbi:MAG: dihydroorotase [Parvicella sp.]|jgi:dihydroorotase